VTSFENSYRLVVRRNIPAPREVVYAAWIDPQGIQEWMCPGDATSAEAMLDVRVGGSYRIVMKGKTRDYVHTGIHQVVDPPAKLVFTWTREESDVATLVTVEFLARGNECELVLTHERFPEAEIMKRYEGGWGQIAEKFAAYLVERSGTAAASRRTAG